MTPEEYKIKIKELRKERDFHQKESNRLAKEMDELVNSIDKEKVDWMIGKYLKIDRRNKGGYLEFFYVDSIDNRPRGYTLYGKGFDISDISIKIDDTNTLFVEDGNLDCISEITKDDFYKAFDEYVKLFREKLNDVSNYKSLGNQFAFKNSMMKATFKLKDENSLSNKVLAILKSE
jgi:hypothetical protein